MVRSYRDMRKMPTLSCIPKNDDAPARATVMPLAVLPPSTDPGWLHGASRSGSIRQSFIAAGECGAIHQHAARVSPYSLVISHCTPSYCVRSATYHEPSTHPMTQPTRLALIGLGKMGQTLRHLAPERGWTLVAEIGARGNERGGAITGDSLRGADVAIEFTTPDAAPWNVRACARAGCPVVVGTTGWDAERPEVERDVLAAGSAMLAAPNLSIGVNVFMQIAEYAARLTRSLPAFDAHIVETHHAAKRDAPSGTALELARRAGAARGHDIAISSIRTGSVPGTHTLLFDGGFEQISLEHVARDRRVFADGALAAARWLVGRRGVFTMVDLMNAYLA